MVNTPPPPAPAPAPEQADDVGSSSGQGGLDRDVNSILANLNQEQLASIVAAARASEGGPDGDAGVDASSILAALPPGLGQAATALTSFASSLRRDNELTSDREHGNGEAKGEEDAGVEGQHVEHHHDGDGGGGEDGHQQHVDESGEDKKHIDGNGDAEHLDSHEYTHVDDSEHHGDQTTGTIVDESTEEYRNEQTQAAIAAMESLAAQSGLQIKGAGRAKRDTGPEAERMRKDQHKEVERKRREQISNGITELANIVPGCDSKGINKTAIINSAVRYIVELKDNEASNIEKWTLEKLLMDQAMGDLSAQLDTARKEISRLRSQLGLPDEPDEPSEPQQYAEEGAQHDGGDDAEHQHHHLQQEGQEHEQEAMQSVTGEEAIDASMDDGTHDKANANSLSQVAEAAIAAAAAQAGHEQGATDAAEGVEEDATDRLESGKGRLRDAGDEEVTEAKEESARAKRSRHA